MTNNNERRSDDQRLASLQGTVDELLRHEQEEQKNWKFEKRISVGNLLTLVALLSVAITAWFTLDKRVVKLEVYTEAAQRQDERDERRANAERSEIRAELDKINLKLDRLAERK